jgi:SMODS and SLOG-associating 2TM effector domain 1/Protein of unknown function (DUF4231)
MVLGVGGHVICVAAELGARLTQVKGRVCPCDAVVSDGQDGDRGYGEFAQASGMDWDTHEIKGVKEGQRNVEVGVDIAQPKLNWIIAGGVQQRQRRRRTVSDGSVELPARVTIRRSSRRSVSHWPVSMMVHCDGVVGSGVGGPGWGCHGVRRGSEGGGSGRMLSGRVLLTGAPRAIGPGSRPFGRALRRNAPAWMVLPGWVTYGGRFQRLGGRVALWHADRVPGENGLVEDLWRQQSIWSQTANRMKASIGRARSATLALTVGGAVLATLAASLPAGHATARSVLIGVAAVGVGLVPVLRPRWSGQVLQDWTRARSVSEALKSEIYLYLAGAGDYRGDDRERRLKLCTDSARQEAADLLQHSVDVEPVQRALPNVHDYASYLQVRIDGQIDGYYRPKARQLRVRLDWFRRVELILAVAAAVLGALAASLAQWNLGAWIAVVTTVSAAVTTHVGAARYEYQLIEYLRTADELSRLRRDAAATTSPADLDQLMVQCERIISIQNEGWMAKLSSTPEQESKS